MFHLFCIWNVDWEFNMKEFTKEEADNCMKGITDGVCHCPTRKKNEVEGNMHQYCLGMVEE